MVFKSPTYCEGRTESQLVEDMLSDPPQQTSSQTETSDVTLSNQLSGEDLRSLLGSSTLINAKNEIINIDSLVGKTIAVYFSASWCPPCKRYTMFNSQIHTSSPLSLPLSP